MKIPTFKFPELNDKFVSRVESELHQFMDAIDSFSDDDWEALPKAEEYNVIQKNKSVPILGKTIRLKLPDVRVYGNGGKPITQNLIIFRF